MLSSIKFLFTLRGNAKACVLTEPLWGIPFNLYAPFITLYMYHLGVMDVGIGIILTVGRLVQIATVLIGGVITDKFGRRKVTLIVDMISWSIPTLIWAFSQNFWWFLAAIIVNGAMQITMVSWECLWLDDIEESKVGPVVNWMYISGLLAIFFAPISGYFVQIHGVVPVMRVIYMIAFVFMTAKFVILYIFSTETKRGLERMEATKNVPVADMFKGYGAVFKQILKSKAMVKALTLQAILGVIMLMTSTFFALYATQNLHIPEGLLAIFPILRAGVMLSFLLVLQSKLSKYKLQNIMLCGIVLYASAMAWLLIAPENNSVWLGVYVIMEACAAALLLPRLETLAANSIDKQERARIRSLFNMVIIAVSSPFGIFAGVLSDINRRLPFILSLVLFLCMIVVVVAGLRDKGEEIAENP